MFKTKFDGGGTKAVSDTIAELVSQGTIAEVPPATVVALTQSSAQKAYIVTDWDAINAARDLKGNRGKFRRIEAQAGEAAPRALAAE